MSGDIIDTARVALDVLGVVASGAWVYTQARLSEIKREWKSEKETFLSDHTNDIQQIWGAIERMRQTNEEHRERIAREQVTKDDLSRFREEIRVMFNLIRSNPKD